MGLSGSSGEELRDGAQSAAKTAKTTKDAVKNTKKAAKGAVKAAKGAVKAAKAAAGSIKAIGAAIAAAGPVGIFIAIIAVLIIIMIMVMTNGVPTTSFNAFTHHNRTQTEITEKELKGEINDLSLCLSEEQEAVTILSGVLMDKKTEAMKQIENLCKTNGTDYEATLQLLDASFVSAGVDIFTNHIEGTYTQEEYDATVLLSGYSVSVDNLWDTTAGNENYPLKGSDVVGGVAGETNFKPKNKQLTTAEYISKEMKSAGYNDIAVCAVLGNMQRESEMSVKATNPDSGAYGLCQWLGSRKSDLKSYCKKNGLDYTTKEGQVAYMLYELSETGYKNVGSKLKNATDLQETTIMFCKKFEQCSESEEVLNLRINYANGYYKAIVGENAEGTRIIDQKHWKTDLREKLEDYFENNSYYEINVVRDEDGNAIKENVTIDTSEDYAGTQEDIEDVQDATEDADQARENLEENERPTQGNDRYEDRQDAIIKNEENMEAEAEKNAEERKNNEVKFEEKTYLQLELNRKEAATLAFNIFDLTEEDIIEVYGEINGGSGEDILHNMAYNNLALLHNVDDPESSLIEEDFTESDYDVGKKIGNFEFTTYCLCGSDACKKNVKKLFGTTNIRTKNKTAGISCAVTHSSGIRPTNTSQTVLFSKGLAQPLVADEWLDEKYDGQNIIAICVGKNHKEGAEITKVVKALKKKTAVHATIGLSPTQARNYGFSGGYLVFGAEDGPVNEKQRKIVINSTKVVDRSGYCLRWVYRVYQGAVGSATRSYNGAYANAAKNTIGTKKSNPPVGAAVYSGPSYTSGSWSPAGYPYGHIGIYIGNGKVRHQVSSVQVCTLKQWCNSFDWGGWNWLGRGGKMGYPGSANL